MAVKLSQLKQDKIRAIVKVGDDEIKIFNPTTENKIKVLEFIKKNKEEAPELDSVEIFSLFLSMFTDIEMDLKEIVDVIASPNKIMIEVLKHLNYIVQDIIYEMLLEQQMSLSMVEKVLMGQELNDKISKINTMVKEIDVNTEKLLN